MYKMRLLAALIATGLFFTTGCKKDSATTTTTTVTVTAAAITNIGTSTATGGGTVTVSGTGSVTDRGVCWATSHNPTTSDSKTSDGTGAGNFSSSLTGLTVSKQYYLRAYAVSGGTTYYSAEVGFTTSDPIELIVNGDFSDPANPNATNVNAVTPWKTEETDTTIIGRGPFTQNGTDYVLWQENKAKGFYQTVGTVPAVKTDYTISFSGNFVYTYWSGYFPTIAVIFSAYTGNDPSTRVTIDTVKVLWSADINVWATKAATFSLPAGSTHAGQNLVVEFNVLTPLEDSGYTGNDDSDLWFDMDKISVKAQ